MADVPLGGKLDEATDHTLKETVTLLEELGHRVETIALPGIEGFADDFLQYWSTLIYAVATFGSKLYDPSFDAARLTPFTQLMAERCRSRARAVPGAAVRLRRSTGTFRDLLQRVDLVVSPTLAQVAPPLGHLASDQNGEVLLDKLLAWMPYTPLANGTGLPAISLPLGFDDDNGVPVGMMFHADLGRDGLLVELAYQLEEARPWPSLAS